MTDYKGLGLKCGLEIHQQLDTQHKLFCVCSTKMAQRDTIATIKRKQHIAASELGEVDDAAQYENLRSRTFHYQVFAGESCLVEADCEPPHRLNPEALRISLETAMLLNCRIPNEIHIMRKTITDGSNTTAFQRTMIVGLNGFLNYKGKKIEITHVSLEEDACAIVKEEGDDVTYRLNRLAVPLVEVGTGLLVGYTPEEIQEIAYLIGIICRSTRKVKTGIGSIRQDINVSIRRGARVEIKGVQELGILSKIVENEVKRQLSLPEVKEETRAPNPDGSTRYMRPLPGAHRLYPETDLQPIFIPRQLVQEIKKQLPEPWTKKLARFKQKLKLSKDLATQILTSRYLDMFEKIVKTTRVESSVVASTFTSTLKDLKRRGVKVENLTDKHFVDIFNHLGRKGIVKEAIPEILKYLADKPEDDVRTVIEKLDLKAINVGELKAIAKEVVRDCPKFGLEKIVGIVMSKVRGKVEARLVMEVVKKMLK